MYGVERALQVELIAQALFLLFIVNLEYACHIIRVLRHLMANQYLLTNLNQVIWFFTDIEESVMLQYTLEMDVLYLRLTLIRVLRLQEYMEPVVINAPEVYCHSGI